MPMGDYGSYTKKELIKKYLAKDRAKLNKYKKATLVAKLRKMMK